MYNPTSNTLVVIITVGIVYRNRRETAEIWAAAGCIDYDYEALPVDDYDEP